MQSAKDKRQWIGNEQFKQQALFSGFCICHFFLKTNMKDAPAALIVILTQAEHMIPAHDHLSDSTEMYLSQITKCICFKLQNVFVSTYKMYLF